MTETIEFTMPRVTRKYLAYVRKLKTENDAEMKALQEAEIANAKVPPAPTK